MGRKKNGKSVLLKQTKVLEELWEQMKKGDVSFPVAKDLHYRLRRIFNVSPAALVKKLGRNPADLKLTITSKTLSLMAEFEKSGFPAELEDFCRRLREGAKKTVKTDKSGGEIQAGERKQNETAFTASIAEILPLDGSRFAKIPPSCHHLLGKILPIDGSENIVVANRDDGRAIYVIAREITLKQVEDIKDIIYKETLSPFDDVMDFVKR